MKKRLFALLLTLIMITPLLPVSAFAGNLPAYDNNNEAISNLPDLGFFMEPQTSSNLVSQICVNGFELPIAGEKSGNYQNLSVPEGSHYSITTKSWFCDSTNSWIDADTLFIEGYFYSCAAEVTLESGYKFADAVEFFANESKDKVDMSWKNDSTGVARVVVNSVKSEKISNTRTVELSASPDSIGTVAGAGVYAVNTEVTVSTSSTDDQNYKFIGWYDGNTCVSENSSYTFTLTDNIVLTAKYKQTTSLELVSNAGNIVDVDSRFYVICKIKPKEVPDSEKDKITLTLNNQEIGTRDEFNNGKFYVDTSDLSLGTNTLTFSYPGSYVYAPCSADFTVVVAQKEKLHIEDLSPAISEAGKPYTISGRILDENGDPYVGYVNVSISKDALLFIFYEFGTQSTDENGGFSVTVNSSTWIPSQDGGKITVRVQTPETDTYSIMNKSSEINFYAHDWQFIKFGGKPVPGKTPGESGYIRFYVNYKCTCEHPGEYEEHDGGHWAVFETTEENSISYHSDARPTCTENGEFLYNFVFDGLDGQADERGIVTKDPALGHDWGEIEYVWSKDGDTWKCTATRTCARNSEHIETETVTARSEVTKQATLTEEGERVYSADFVNSDFETQTKNENVPKLTETAIPITTPDTGEKEGGDNDFAVLSPQTGYESNPTPWGVLLILLCCLAIIVFSCLKTRRAFFIIKKSFSDTDK